jgi:ankyrin repeat protein
MRQTVPGGKNMRAKYLGGWWMVPLLAVCMARTMGAAGRERSLVDSVKQGNASLVRTLLREHADVNDADRDGTTALHWAVHNDDLPTVELLIRARSNVKAANRYGVLPLTLACITGNAAIAERLLTAGADVNSVSPEGQTALMTAARTGSLQVLQLLLAHGADVNAKERVRGQTALMWAAAQGHAAVIRTLLEAGADLHQRSKGNPGGVRAAVGAGVSQIAVGNAAGGTAEAAPATTGPAGPAGFTPLLFAARAGHVDAARALLDAGANANETVGDGTSALALTVMNAHYELAALLLDKGADPNADDQGWTALHQLVWTRRPNVLRPVPYPNPTGNLSDLQLVKELVAHGANPNARQKREPNDGNRNTLNRLGATAFLNAAKAGDAEMMRTLVANGADPRITTNEGTTALMVAAGVGLWRVGESTGTNEEALEAVKLAWELGGDVNAINNNGDAAVHGAVHRGANAIVQFLADKGARLDPVNVFGWSPLTIAQGVWYPNTYKSEPETAALLLKLGANPTIGKRRPEDYPPSEISGPLDPNAVSTTTNGTFTGRAREAAPAATPPAGTAPPKK